MQYEKIARVRGRDTNTARVEGECCICLETRCLLFCGTERNGTPNSVKYLFYGTAQKQAATASHLIELLLWTGCRCIPSKYSAIIADVLTIIASYIHGLSYTVK